MICHDNEIHFLNSFKADTNVVPSVIASLNEDLMTMQYSRDDIDEIVLSMDEAITNAVQETLHEQELDIVNDKAAREITIRYRITPVEFDATIIDHGRGLDMKKMMKKIPNSKCDNYHDQVFDYVEKAENKKLQVRLNGREITLNGIGAGLKIIMTFMDSITIDLMDKRHVISDTVTDFSDGTILNMSRKRRN